jgi:thiol-disulfide isomerase/thioredoxin
MAIARDACWGLAVIALIAGCGSPTAAPPVTAPPVLSADVPMTEAPATDPPIVAEVTAEPAPADTPAESLPAAEPADPHALRPLTWHETQSLIAQQKGKIVVVDVWSTSCEPCLREFPHLITLQVRYPDDVVCIGLNCDYVGIKKKPPESYVEKVTKVLDDYRAKIVNVLCTTPSDDLFAAVEIGSIPAVLVFDRTGQRLHTFDNRTPSGDGEGISYETQIAPAVAKLVEAKAE